MKTETQIARFLNATLDYIITNPSFNASQPDPHTATNYAIFTAIAAALAWVLEQTPTPAPPPTQPKT